MDEKSLEDQRAEEIYQETYNRSLENTNRQIEEAEYLRNNLISGGAKRYFTRKLKRTC